MKYVPAFFLGIVVSFIGLVISATVLSELYAKIPKNPKVEILGSVRVQTLTGLSLKIVFVQNRNPMIQGTLLKGSWACPEIKLK